jgi:Transglycosylase-like domain
MGVVIPATVHRLLTKRKHIALAGTVAALAAPAPALAAHHDGGADVGIADARPASPGVLAPLQLPVVRFQDLIHTTAARFRAEHRAAVERERRTAARRESREAREQRERFAALPGGVSIATLESIAFCESGGDPAAVSADGTYRGKYQFDEGTWESVGGHGDPAAAPAVEQDYRAALLYSRAGSSPWPICG